MRNLVAFIIVWTCICPSHLVATGQPQAIDSLKQVLAKVPDSVAVKVLNELSWHYKNSQVDTALYYATKAYDLADLIENQRLLAASLNSLGDTYQAIGRYDTALVILGRSVNIYIAQQDSSELARVYNNMGIIYDEKAAYQQALTHYFLGLRVAEGSSQLALQANILGNIGIVYKKQKEPVKVLEYYNKALEVYLQLDHKFGITVTSGNIGSVLIQVGKYHESITHSEKAISGYKELGYLRYVPYSLGNIGIAYDSLGKHSTAKAFYEQAFEEHLSFENRYEAAYNAKNLAFLLWKQGDLKSASSYATQAISMAGDIGAKEMLKDAYDAYSKILFSRGDFKEAYIYKDRYMALQNELFEENKTKNIFELQAQYETEKKEQQIRAQNLMIAEEKAINQRNLAISLGVFLALVFLIIVMIFQKNRLKKKQQLVLQRKDLEFKELQLNAIIDSQEKERKRFASDLHDGFGQLISILKLNVESVQNENDNVRRHTIYEKSVDILNEMYLELKSICFNLMPQSLVKFGLTPSLKEFAEKINFSEKLFVEVLIFELDERLTDLQEISIYRIVQEWVNNIMKYSDAQKVTIQITRDEDEITLTIEDDGMGFDLVLLTNGKGNGWKNIRSRTNLIHGDIEIDSTPQYRGNTLMLNIPVAVKKTEEVGKIASES